MIQFISTILVKWPNCKISVYCASVFVIMIFQLILLVTCTSLFQCRSNLRIIM